MSLGRTALGQFSSIRNDCKEVRGFCLLSVNGTILAVFRAKDHHDLLESVV